MINRISYIVYLIFYIFFVYGLLPTAYSYSQSDILKYAHTVIDTLASPSMHGRGYVNKGDSMAADYIKKEFEKFGLKPIGKEFYQRFSFPVNIFPNEMFIKIINNSIEKELIPGKDYIVSATSSGLRGMYEPISTYWFDSTSVYTEEALKVFLSHTLSQHIIIVDTIESIRDYLFKR